MRCLNGVLSLDGTLSTKMKELRTQFFVFICAGWMSTVMTLATTSGAQKRHPIAAAGTVVALIALSIGIGAVLCRVPLTTRVVVGTLYGITGGILLWDLNSRTDYYSYWPLLVLIIDMLLVMQVPTQYSIGLVGFTLLWLSVLGLEESFRFGLFDIPGSSPMEGEFGRMYIT